MARLTILQASQQGFGSTLTIHRHIKDGNLPVYEDGDTKLLEVDDLIAVLGEPKSAFVQEEAPVSSGGRVDMHEYNRLKADLEQQTKKNMWLTADLAEAVRAVKEKEEKFDKERERLLTVLEQAQALLLRAEGQIGAVKPASATEADPASSAEENSAVGAHPIAGGGEPGASIDELPEIPDANNLAGVETIKSESGTSDKKIDVADDGTVSSEMTPEQEKLFAPFPQNAEAQAASDEPDKKAETESVNPLIPPLEDPANAKSGSSRSLGTMTWLLLFMLAGGGFVFFEYRTKVLIGVSKVLQALS